MTATLKKVKFHDGRKLVIRQPAVAEDLDRLVLFLSGLPPETRNYLRYNVTEKETCQRRLRQIDGQDHWRLIAEVDGAIVGDATMDREPFTWTRHVAEVRSVVDHAYQGLGVGSILLSELVALGAEAGIEMIYTEVMREQTALIGDLEKSGFVREAVRKNYAKDLDGKRHDVILMANDLERLWENLAQLLEELDVRSAMEG